MAITLNKNTRICGKKMFETKIKNIFVVLIEDNEEYLENRKLAVSERTRIHYMKQNYAPLSIL